MLFFCIKDRVNLSSDFMMFAKSQATRDFRDIGISVDVSPLRPPTTRPTTVRTIRPTPPVRTTVFLPTPQRTTTSQPPLWFTNGRWTTWRRPARRTTVFPWYFSGGGWPPGGRRGARDW